MRPFRLAVIVGMLSAGTVAPAQPKWIPWFYPVEVHSEHGDFILADAMIDASGMTLRATVTDTPPPQRQAQCNAAVTIVTQHVHDPMERRLYDATVDQISRKPGAMVQFRIEHGPIKVSSFSQLRGVLADVTDCATPPRHKTQAGESQTIAGHRAK
jgi:hypothetical protein